VAVFSFAENCPAKLLAFQDQGVGDHVVQRLFSGGEGGHDEADGKRYKAGNNFCEEAPAGAAKGDAMPLHIGDVHAHGLLAPGGLLFAAFQVSVIKPLQQDADEGKRGHEENEAGHEGGIDVRVSVPWKIGNARTDAAKEEERQEDRQANRAEDQRVDQMSKEARPEVGVGEILRVVEASDAGVGGDRWSGSWRTHPVPWRICESR
jgi:hypothetical protein